MDFTTRYSKLNDNQKRAVNTIDGPVMVVAGPGTGKTELLSMRAANILKKTDVLPENILCLTFTDSGSVAMRKRLTEIIGRDAYNVSIYTFHAFGSEIISRYREHFYQGADFRPADTLNQYRIISSILDTLRYDDPLKTTINGAYTAIADISSSISDIKRSGLTDGELLAILEANHEAIEIAEPLIRKVFSPRISKSTADNLAAILPTIEAIQEKQVVSGLPRFSEVLVRSMRRALEEATVHPKITPPLTAWKKQWLTTDPARQLILKARKQQTKLMSLHKIYTDYLKIMQAAGLYDYDDMIMQVVHALEVHADLRYDLQEKYQYIMVDEFQDTNLAQMRILNTLCDNPVNEGKPNILVVGDDDQAIYGFQGADIGNILSFRDSYQAVELITLTDNYRSVAPVLASAREVILQGEERLERHIPELDKTLTPHASHSQPKAAVAVCETPSDERSWLVESVKQQLESGVAANQVAVLARRHSELEAILGYFAKANIPISYDKRENILDDEVITQLELLGNIIVALFEGDLEEANGQLPRLLSHPAWGIKPETVWHISLTAYKKRSQWLEEMNSTEETKPLHAWLLKLSQLVPHQPLERILDVMIGNVERDDEYISPLKEYFFSESVRHEKLGDYISHLNNLTSLRTKLREHDPNTTTSRLPIFLEFLAACREAGTQLVSLRHIGDDSSSVQLMSAHGSKGLEFDTVYIMNATDAAWGEHARGRTPIITYPENMRLAKNNSTYDERLRLFFVAMTRAKRQLFISYARENDQTKEMLKAGFLTNNAALGEQIIPTQHVPQVELEAAEQAWYAPVVELPHATMHDYLADTLKNYKLSATHINNFIDIARGGPRYFLLNNLLHFPSAMGPYAGFGNAVHASLQQAHDFLRATKQPQPEEDIVRTFEEQLQRQQLSAEEYEQFLQRGADALATFLQAKYSEFLPEQRAELDFSRQEVYIGDVHLTGKLDVVTFNDTEKTASVIDYKTGAPLTSWDKGDDYRKIKAHKYRQQLLFYKLLLENSREWRHYTMSDARLQFIEPDKSGQIIELALGDITPEEIADFKQLVEVVWRHIQTLDFPDISGYEPTYKGILAFEKDLRAT